MYFRRYDLGGKDSVDATASAHSEKKKPITNADRIRSMTDEKLAIFICDYSCAYCPMDDCLGRITVGRDACYKRWLVWLKREVDYED